MKAFALPTLLTIAAMLLAGGCAVSIGDTVELPRAATPASSASLAVRFEGIEKTTGQIMLSVFDSAAAHDQGGTPIRATAVPVEGNKATVRFTGLAPGEYAIKAFHDVDGDGDMDTNPFGMPIGPFAFSNNAKAEGGPAPWEAARFTIAAGENTIGIAIK